MGSLWVARPPLAPSIWKSSINQWYVYGFCHVKRVASGLGSHLVSVSVVGRRNTFESPVVQDHILNVLFVYNGYKCFLVDYEVALVGPR